MKPPGRIDIVAAWLDTHDLSELVRARPIVQALVATLALVPHPRTACAARKGLCADCGRDTRMPGGFFGHACHCVIDGSYIARGICCGRLQGDGE